MRKPEIRLRTIVSSGTTIFVGTAVLGLVAEVVHQHVAGARSGEEGAHDHDAAAPDDHRHEHVSFRHGRLSLRHDDGPFGLVLNSLGGAVAAWEGYRLTKRRTHSPAAHAAIAAISATAAHALGHVALDRDNGDVRKTVASACHMRLLSLSVAGAVAGSRVALRVAAP